MVIHNDPFFSLYFGDTRTQFTPAEYRHEQQHLLNVMPFSTLKKNMPLEQLIFLHQTHGTQGISITSSEQAKTLAPFQQEGDFLMTQLTGIGLAIATADCLPIIVYDSFNHVIALIHAGWRGSAHNVSIVALERMQQAYNSSLDHIKVFFGPSAKACCYKVGDEVVQQLERFSFGSEVLYKVGSDILLDLPLFNRLQLEEYGIKKDAFHTSYNACTICDASFCSYRRERNQQRQMTVVLLK